MEWFIWLMFGHFFADFAFQNSWMATNKKHLELACAVHCTIYTVIVTTFLAFGGIEWSFLLYFLVFISHWVLDYTFAVDNWIRFINTRSWDTSLPRKRGTHNIPNRIDNIQWQQPLTTKQVVQTVFGSIIYVVIDNITHLFMMFLIVKVLK